MTLRRCTCKASVTRPHWQPCFRQIPKLLCQGTHFACHLSALRQAQRQMWCQQSLQHRHRTAVAAIPLRLQRRQCKHMTPTGSLLPAHDMHVVHAALRAPAMMRNTLRRAVFTTKIEGLSAQVLAAPPILGHCLKHVALTQQECVRCRAEVIWRLALLSCHKARPSANPAAWCAQMW